MRFSLYEDDDRGCSHYIYVNPLAVASVAESERRRAYGASQPVAVILMTDGTNHVVYDYDRKASAELAAEIDRLQRQEKTNG